MSLNNLATCHSYNGDYGAAVLLREEALAMLRRLLPEGHEEIGRCSKALGDDDRAMMHFKMVQALLSDWLPADDPELVQLSEATAGPVDWSSQSVGELEAFLRSRGLDPGEGTDKEDLVQVAMALAADGGDQGRTGESSTTLALAGPGNLIALCSCI
jgi:hypothetical protein